MFISGAIAGGTARLLILLLHNWVKSLNLVPSGLWLDLSLDLVTVLALGWELGIGCTIFLRLYDGFFFYFQNNPKDLDPSYKEG